MIALIIRSLRFYARTHAGVALGAVLAAAVLTGALLVGDSVDATLARFANLRLGKVHNAINAQGFFFDETLGATFDDAVPALYLRGIAIAQGDTREDQRQVNRIDTLGVDDTFWPLMGDAQLSLGPREVALNETLANALLVSEGEEISLRVEKPSLLAKDAPLSNRGEDPYERGRYTVKRVLSDDQGGRFSLAATQVAPYNAFVNRAWLQSQVDLEGKSNLLLLGGDQPRETVEAALKESLRAEHLGLRFTAHPSGVVQLESDRIFLDAETERAALALPGAKGTLSYLVNALEANGRSTPYSFMAAGPVPADMADDEIVINRWLADTLGAQIGTEVTVRYYELLANNDYEERSRVFKVHSVREMESLEDERDLMPLFPGLSDVESCTEWDIGMPMEEDLLKDKENEAYWDAYHQTPKALVTLAAGQAMWANRFGRITAVRFPGGEGDRAALAAALAQDIDPSKAGLFVADVKNQADRAVANAMDFGGLFLGMSFFIVVAALMVTGLLFVFGVQQRADQMGLLFALGLSRTRVRVILLSEGAVVALAGSIVGALLGLAYTRALLYGLSQLWSDAVAGAAIQFHASATTVITGALASFACALIAMVVAFWRQSRHSARELLQAASEEGALGRAAPRNRKRALALPSLGIAISLSIVLFSLTKDVSTLMMPFFAAGALLLLSGIGLCRWVLIQATTGASAKPFSLRRLSLGNAARRRSRSLTVVATLACGCFLVFAVSSMQENLDASAGQRSSGTGGFALLAESTFPLTEDPAASLEEEGVSVARIKVRDGAEASCLNLNQVDEPRLLGIHIQDMVSRGAFAGSAEEAEALWALLNTPLENGAIPALVGDANTAMWTLKKKTGVEKGDTLTYRDELGNEVPIKLVGALPMMLSIFQGTVLISDEAFTKLYPTEGGYRMFLVDVPSPLAADTAKVLKRTYERNGLDAIPAVQRLHDYHAVEAAYMAMFLALGALGLIVGSAGMGAVVLRNLLDRRSELAVYQALGYRNDTIRRMLYTEYGALLAAGLGTGGLSAAISMVPFVMASASGSTANTALLLFVVILTMNIVCVGLAVRLGFAPDDTDALRSE